MKSASHLTWIFVCCLSTPSFSQDYSYTHYDITDGLAGSVVYCITQDKDGFIWTGTETGVSRFDGTHFKTFTIADGLPDIEVLEIFGDSKGRVWMAPFRKSVCYYYQGRMYNQENDSLLRRIRLRENVEHFAEDAKGNILIQERTALQMVGTDGTVHEYDSIGGKPIRKCAGISRSPSGNFLVQEGKQVFAFSETGSSVFCSIPMLDALPGYLAMNPAGMIWRVDLTHSAIRSFVAGKTISLPFERFHYKHLSFTTVGDSLFYYNELSGSTEYNIHTGRFKQFLPGKEVSRTFRDAMGNTWFTTIGQGIFRLNSDEFRTIAINASGMEASSVHAIRRFGDRLLVGDNHSYISVYSLPKMEMVEHGSLGGTAKNRILFVGRMANGHLYIASDEWLIEGLPYYHSGRCLIAGIKDVWEKDKNELLFSTHWGVGLLDLTTFRVKDTLWRERSTTLYYRKDTLYVGTLNGLYRVSPDRSTTFLGKNIPFLQKRISAIAESEDGTLWIASYDAGVIGYRNGHVIAVLTKRNGLTSNICRKLLVQQHLLWIGTDKGLNRVRTDRLGYPVIQYSSNDGLGSDMINSIYADGSTIYVGTAAGLSYFDEAKVNNTEGCRLYLLSVLNAGNERIGDTAHLLIPYQDKHIRLEFAGISYRSVGSIQYHYRMRGLDTGWQETRETFLEYPTLPSGKYTFQLEAINKFGTKSALLNMPFEIVTPFWQTAWFYGLVILLFLSLVWLFVSLRIKNIRRRQKEKEQLSYRLAEMEHTALQSQMNPHFIFNCLNSIQQYIFDQETLAANRYLTGFARLIRATLNNSSKAFISLADEIDYLSTYLSLEKMRFKEKMDYVIQTELSIHPEQYIIPPMLIQPFVENSMRHGLRHKTEGNGYIYIRISLAGDKLVVVVEDNGIGRKKAAGYKTREHIEYQSKGMSLTADRIRMMNKKYYDSIQIEVIDLEDDAGQPAGTRVVMQFPLFHMTTPKEAL